ncbi:MAG: gluconate 2-dehydrogenase subunit 3 family protein, partial [Verrucomicrobia bacterium]|nr:gluconate 2-dehydrogenase subunit 3 family protein [Verrucomicrobiota bacterium]
YVINQLAGPCAHDAELISVGLAQLDATAATRPGGSAFATLSVAEQDALLTALDTAGDPFFNRLVDLAHEGFYADPANGGNRDGVSWHMLGYDPRITPPTKPSGHRNP